MKKLFTCLVILTACLVALSCASNPDSYVPEPSTRAALLGEWTQVNGSSVITIEEKDWTIIDMERGLAGYGPYNFRSESQVRFRWTSILDFNKTTSFVDASSPTKPFQKDALEEYHRRFPERLENLRKELAARGMSRSSSGSKGSDFYDFVVSDNVLTIKWARPGEPGYFLVNDALTGEFLKTRESTIYYEGNRER